MSDFIDAEDVKIAAYVVVWVLGLLLILLALAAAAGLAWTVFRMLGGL